MKNCYRQMLSKKAVDATLEYIEFYIDECISEI